MAMEITVAELGRALPWVLRHEGGWSHDPMDRGGATMFGITLAVAQRHGIPDADALKAITPEKAEAIYRADYWKFDGVEDQRVATKVFDMAVNMGLGTAVKLLQRALAIHGWAVVIDGVFGPLTLKAVNGANPTLLLGQLASLSLDHYRRIVDKDPTQIRFLGGWERRAKDLP